jgi:tellurite resistance protein TerC
MRHAALANVPGESYNSRVDSTVANPYVWAGFGAFVLAMLALDLGVFHRKAHEIGAREATAWSVFWILLALAFNAGVWRLAGREAALQFLTAYVIEKSLSVDNLFVFLVIFSYFRVPPQYQHKVLFWGILGALIMRGVFIFGGLALLHYLHWAIYVFGGILVLTGLKLIVRKEGQVDPGKNPVLRLAKRIFPTVTEYHGARFLVRHEGRIHATPLVLVLIVVETTDVVFAVDSVPAVLAVSRDPFIVYTSNVFAILGLRALYFLLAAVMSKLHLLRYGLGVVLAFVGVKMLLGEDERHNDRIPIEASLAVVGGVLAASMLLSLLVKPKAFGAG